jgi:hypothetical protein
MNVSILKPGGSFSPRTNAGLEFSGAGFTTLLCEVLSPGVFIACALANDIASV